MSVLSEDGRKEALEELKKLFGDDFNVLMSLKDVEGFERRLDHFLTWLIGQVLRELPNKLSAPSPTPQPWLPTGPIRKNRWYRRSSVPAEQPWITERRLIDAKWDSDVASFSCEMARAILDGMKHS